MTRALLFALALCPAALGGEPALMRYKLEPGTKLVYRAKGDGDRAVEWTATVLRTNPDGSARVLLRLADGKLADGVVEAKSTNLATVDIAPDGRLAPGAPQEVAAGLVFPILPPDAEAAATGWVSDSDGTTTRATPLGGNRFSAVGDGPMEHVYATRTKKTYDFDPKCGAVGSWEFEMTSENGKKTVSKGKLESVGSVPPAELQALAADAERCFAATAAYDAAFRSAPKLAPDLAQATLDKAKAALEVAAEAVARPEFKPQLDTKLKSHAVLVKYALADIRARAKVVGKPAFAVEATTLDGKRASLADYKGKVVVLDFWYRGCGWCIRAMPQMNQLADDFKNDPVAILGLNTDRERKDAEFVIKTMQLKYPTLCIKHDSAGEFGVQGFPTLVLLDRKGVVRELHVGYSADLREQVGKAVRGLLAEGRK